MSITLIIGVTAFVVVVGGIIALLWFRMAARAVPYRDEVERRRRSGGGSGGGARAADDDGVVVIDSTGSPRGDR